MPFLGLSPGGGGGERKHGKALISGLLSFSPWSTELPGKQEPLCAIYAVLEQLPRANHDTLERLIFHLVK